MREALVRRLENAWYYGAWWLYLLRPIALVFRGMVALRRACYGGGLLPIYRPDVPVIVVGNITVGGTGKTPVVIALVAALQARGISVGVVSRGYGASKGSGVHRVTDSSTPDDCGDEPLLIYRRCRCPLVTATSRAAAARTLRAKNSIDLIVSDDGLQHYALARDMEIVMVDARSSFGNGRCLPAGPLREPLARLDAVDFVLGRDLDDPDAGVRYESESLVNILTGETKPVSVAGIGKEVVAIAAIGRPAMFFNALRAAGFNIEERVYRDHYPYRAGDFSGLTDKPIIMTEKDAVKCMGLVGANAWYLKINAVIPDPVIQAAALLVNR